MNLFYTVLSGFYDLLDVIYFRNPDRSPRKAVLDRIGEKDEILDLCTGTASGAMAIARQKPGARVIGVDLSEDMLKTAQTKIRKAGLQNISLLEMDATKLAFRSGRFDKILISLVLHELDEDLAAKLILEAKRVLDDDGEIIITEWEPSPRLWQRALFFPIGCLEPEPYHRFVKKDLNAYFAQHGLRTELLVHCDYTKVLVLKKENDLPAQQ